MIYKCKEKQSFTEGKNTTGFLTLQDDKQESITGDMIHTNRLFRFIDRFGLTTMGRFLKDLLYTTKMITPSIMKYPTYNSWENPSIVECTAHAQKLLDLRYETLKRHVKKQSYGIPLWRQENGKKSVIQKDNL